MKHNSQPKHLFKIDSTDTILLDRFNDKVMNDLYQHFTNIHQIKMTTYREGQSITELVIQYDNEKTFLLTIWQGELCMPPITSEDIRVAHKEISLPDTTDILVLVTRIALHAHLSPRLSSDFDSAEVLVFNS